MHLIIPKYVFRKGQTNFSYYSGDTGDGIPRHEHTFSHYVMVAHGKICIRKENLYREFIGGDEPINLRENEWHEIEILEDNTVFINFGEGNQDV